MYVSNLIQSNKFCSSNLNQVSSLTQQIQHSVNFLFQVFSPRVPHILHCVSFMQWSLDIINDVFCRTINDKIMYTQSDNGTPLSDNLVQIATRIQLSLIKLILSRQSTTSAHYSLSDSFKSYKHLFRCQTLPGCNLYPIGHSIYTSFSQSLLRNAVYTLI